MTEEAATSKRLTTEQRDQLLAWIAEGLETDEINRRAAAQDPPWNVGRTTVSHYRKTRQINHQEIRQHAEAAAVAAGYATAAERVSKLAALAGRLEADIMNGRLWLKRKKGIGFGRNSQVVEEEEFNEAEVRQYRGLLEDIAKELGERSTRIKVDEEVALIWDLPVPGWTPPANQPPDSSD